jgi:hypothetical protein
MVLRVVARLDAIARLAAINAFSVRHEGPIKTKAAAEAAALQTSF